MYKSPSSCPSPSSLLDDEAGPSVVHRVLDPGSDSFCFKSLTPSGRREGLIPGGLND